MFLNKEQVKHLEKNGWEIPPTKDGTFWFGQDFDDMGSCLSVINDMTPLAGEDEDGNEFTGYDFLVVAMRPNVTEPEEE